MSFFNRRRGRQPQQESDRLKNIPDPSHASEKSSIRRFRHISTFTLFSSKFSRRPVENTVDFPTGSYRYGSRSPSPDPSLDIRMPAGLGRRASEMEERDCEGPLRQEGVNKYHDRQRSVSSPPFSQLMRWREGLASSDEHHSMASRSAITRIPPELLSTVFSFGARTDILSLAQVSKMFRSSALQALYSVLDLRDLDDERMERCVASIASRRDVAGLVRVFGCRSLPSYDNGPTSLTTVTFAIAFANMSQLSTLILPRFDANILFHAPFSLNSLTLLSTTISPDEFPWVHVLAGWSAVHTLTLPSQSPSRQLV
ncbi:hypothetical protein A0H81_07094 [Grifola frondosa]|uniref:F-box domain-containing protein n=1 Tax=Grifola frondosa TaxID=5627 RepID=A0A1C7M8A8_GRIFR|nr:hypothetical protein A0H81_07094 [Grifola frondosa]